jgi:hypothetical protein
MGSRGPRPYLRMEKFSEACVIASTHTILLVQNAFDAGYLSRRNPAVIYFLFAATLVILSNQFAGLYRVDASDMCIANAISIMNYCAESDAQASRLVYILSTFRDVVTQQRARRKQSQADHTHLPSISSQLYGVSMPSQSGGNLDGLGNASDGTNATPRLHQVPIHIYPGMQTAPASETPVLFSQTQPQAQAQAHTHRHSQAPSDFSVHLTPIHDPESAASDAWRPGTTTVNSPSKPSSLSTMLDLSALEATRVPSLHSEESGLDEHIDFDALWAWPSNTPATGSPRPAGPEGAGLDSGGQDGAVPVPLFGVSHGGIAAAQGT